MLRLVKLRIWVFALVGLLCLQGATEPILVIKPESEGYYIGVVAAMATEEKLFLITEQRASARSMEALVYTLEAWPLPTTKGPIWRKSLSTVPGIKNSLPSDLDPEGFLLSAPWHMVEKEGSLFLLYDQSELVGSTSQLIYRFDEEGDIIASDQLGIDDALFSRDAFPRPYFEVIGFHRAPKGLAISYSSGTIVYINQDFKEIATWNPASTSIGATLFTARASDIDGDSIFVLGSTHRIPLEKTLDPTMDIENAFRISFWVRKHTLGSTISSDFQSDVGTISQPMNVEAFDILVKDGEIIVVGIHDPQDWSICKLSKASPKKPTCTEVPLSDDISKHVEPVWLGIPPNITEMSNGYIWNTLPIPKRSVNMEYAFLVGSHSATIGSLRDAGIVLDRDAGAGIIRPPLLAGNGDDALAILTVGEDLDDHLSFSIEVHKISLGP